MENKQKERTKELLNERTIQRTKKMANTSENRYKTAPFVDYNRP